MNFKDIHTRLDYAGPDEIMQVQQALLIEQLAYAQKNSPYYRRLFKSLNINADSIINIAAFKKLPTTSKKELAENNTSFFAASTKDIVEFVTTSGTTGSPIAVALTQSDLDRLAYNEARALAIATITDLDVVEITTTLDKRFMAGMAYYLGLNKIGAASVRTGLGHLKFQWDTIKQFQISAIIGVPSFLKKLFQFGKENGFTQSASKIICIGEPIRNADFSPNPLAEHLLKLGDFKLFSTYASTETASAFTECEAQNGGHHLPELCLLEVLDDSGNEVADGHLGEITITPLGVRGTPILRFRTGDLARKHNQKCGCGRTTSRLGPIEARKDLMLKYKGTSIFPQQIEQILHQEDVTNYVIQLTNDSHGMDDILLCLEKDLPEELLLRILNNIHAALRVKPKIESLPPAVLNDLLYPEGSRKPMKIQDRRNA